MRYFVCPASSFILFYFYEKNPAYLGFFRRENEKQNWQLLPVTDT